MTTLTEILNDPEVHYPGNFDTPQRANALLTGLCQDAAAKIEQLQAEILEQCRINGMSAEREDALRAKVERLNKAVADEREWVGLTAADVHAAFLVCLDKEDEVGLFAQTIEAKLKEKNT